MNKPDILRTQHEIAHLAFQVWAVYPRVRISEDRVAVFSGLRLNAVFLASDCEVSPIEQARDYFRAALIIQEIDDDAFDAW